MTAHPTGSPAVAVTGIGVLTPLGDSVESLEAALRAGKVAVEAATDLDGAAAARIADFEATRYANVRGLRLYSRPTRLGICASRLALAGAGLETGVAPEDLGVIVASTFAHMETLLEYDRSVVSAGIARTNPALMPLAIPSAPGAAVALSFVAKAFSITLADGGTSGLDALGLGARLVASGRARACLVVGMFPVVPELVLSASKAGLLAPAGDFRVLDRRRCGTAFGEAGVAFVLERLDEARARGATPLAIVAGQASAFEVDPSGLEGAIARACRDALAGARHEPGRRRARLVRGQRLGGGRPCRGPRAPVGARAIPRPAPPSSPPPPASATARTRAGSSRRSSPSRPCVPASLRRSPGWSSRRSPASATPWRDAHRHADRPGHLDVALRRCLGPRDREPGMSASAGRSRARSRW